MSEAPDREDKTEDASEKKKSDALEKGQTAHSRDAATAAGLVGVWAALALSAPALTPAAARGLAGLFESSTQIRLRGAEDVASLLWLVTVVAAPAALLMALPPALGAVLGHVAQGAPRIAWSRVAPDFSKLSPAAGWRRLFGRDALKSGGLTLLKLVVALAALVWIGVKMTAPTLDSIGRAPGLLPSATLALALDVVAPLVLIAALAGGGDFALSRFKWLADLRMTKHEVKEELRQAEGDPHVRQRVRSIRMQRARRRMIAAVPRATMVVANPTHYAIALRYVRGETAAPLVVAKGVDAMALTIRKIAEEAGVPVIEDKALARSMYDQVSVDQMIPAAFYAAVAELVHALSKAAAERARPRVAISAGAPIQ